jgi:hypothetical protein
MQGCTYIDTRTQERHMRYKRDIGKDMEKINPHIGTAPHLMPECGTKPLRCFNVGLPTETVKQHCTRRCWSREFPLLVCHVSIYPLRCHILMHKYHLISHHPSPILHPPHRPRPSLQERTKSSSTSSRTAYPSTAAGTRRCPTTETHPTRPHCPQS